VRTSSAGRSARRVRSVPHIRASQRDRQRQPPRAPPPRAVTAWLTEPVSPAALNTFRLVVGDAERQGYAFRPPSPCLPRMGCRHGG
jgi:hypothetical protein